MKIRFFRIGVIVVMTSILSWGILGHPVSADRSQSRTISSNAMWSGGNLRQNNGDAAVLAPTAVIIVGGTIGASTTWSAGNVYVVLDQDVVLGPGVTLTIQAGAIVKFNLGRSLYVTGLDSALRVLGSAGNPVYLTSYRDDTVGGDTNNDGSATTPAPGDWVRIQFGANSNDANSLIDHANVRYGGRAYYNDAYGAITLYNASPIIQNSTIRDSQYYAYRADLSSFPTLTNNTLVNNGINGLTLTNDGYGGILNTNATWNIVGTTYYIRDGFSIGLNTTLTLASGVVVKFEIGRSLIVDGNNSALRVLGTAANPVTFTSIRDDTVGGDTNNDSSATTAAPGDWYRIQFGADSNDANSLIDHANVRYGGRAYYNDAYGAITLYSASPIIQNSTIHDSQYYGILTNTSTPNLRCNNIYDNGNLSGGHRYYGLYNATTSVTVVAENQWWGSATGPYHPTTNPNGLGNAVTGGVSYSPWLQAACGDAGSSHDVFLPMVLR